MKRLKWIACILLLAVAAYLGAVGVVWLTRPTPGFTQENARLLRRGMTLEQIEALFACKGERTILWSESNCFEWHNERAVWVLVVFDKADKLQRAYLLRSADSADDINVNDSFFDWLRRMLRL